MQMSLWNIYSLSFHDFECNYILKLLNVNHICCKRIQFDSFSEELIDALPFCSASTPTMIRPRGQSSRRALRLRGRAWRSSKSSLWTIGPGYSHDRARFAIPYSGQRYSHERSLVGSTAHHIPGRCQELISHHRLGKSVITVCDFFEIE